MYYPFAPSFSLYTHNQLPEYAPFNAPVASSQSFVHPYEETKNLLFQHIKQGSVHSIQEVLTYTDSFDIQQDSTTLLHAISTGNKAIVRLLLESGFRPDLCDPQQRISPLHAALHKGFTDIALMLVEKHWHNLTLMEFFFTPLQNMQAFVNAFDAQGKTPLILAVLSGNVNIAHALICHGADINLQDSAGNTALHHTLLLESHTRFLPLFLELGTLQPEIENSCGSTPLFLAIRFNLPDAASALIDWGKASVNHTNKEGQNALHIAVNHYENPAIIQTLFKSGVNINHIDNKGKTPLDIVCSKVYNQKVRELLDILTSHPDATRDAAALIEAVIYNQLETVKFLVEKKGFDPGLKHNGLTAAYYAKNLNQQDILKYFKKTASHSISFAKELNQRKLLAHVTDTGGISNISPTGAEAEAVQAQLCGFNSRYIYHFLSKRIAEYPKINPLLDRQLINTLKKTSAFAAQNHSVSQLYSHWQAGNALYIEVGTSNHSIGMYIDGNEIVWCNRWADESGSHSSYRAFCFNHHLLSNKILKKLTSLNPTVQEKLQFLTTELPRLLEGKKYLFHQILENYKISAQSPNVGNCSWVNSQGMQLPHCILYEMRKLCSQNSYPSEKEIHTLIRQQANLCDNFLSFYQLYLANKSLRNIQTNKGDYEPDWELVSRTFTACYPYSKESVDPILIMDWKATEKLFNKYMPTNYTAEYKSLKENQQNLEEKLKQIGQLLTSSSHSQKRPHSQALSTHSDTEPSAKRKKEASQTANKEGNAAAFPSDRSPPAFARDVTNFITNSPAQGLEIGQPGD